MGGASAPRRRSQERGRATSHPTSDVPAVSRSQLARVRSAGERGRADRRPARTAHPAPERGHQLRTIRDRPAPNQTTRPSARPATPMKPHGVSTGRVVLALAARRVLQIGRERRNDRVRVQDPRSSSGGFVLSGRERPGCVDGERRDAECRTNQREQREQGEEVPPNAPVDRPHANGLANRLASANPTDCWFPVDVARAVTTRRAVEVRAARALPGRGGRWPARWRRWLVVSLVVGGAHRAGGEAGAHAVHDAGEAPHARTRRSRGATATSRPDVAAYRSISSARDGNPGIAVTLTVSSERRGMLGVVPVHDERAEIGERVAERAQLPVEHRARLVRRGRSSCCRGGSRRARSSPGPAAGSERPAPRGWRPARSRESPGPRRAAALVTARTDSTTA